MMRIASLLLLVICGAAAGGNSIGNLRQRRTGQQSSYLRARSKAAASLQQRQLYGNHYNANGGAYTWNSNTAYQQALASSGSGSRHGATMEPPQFGSYSGYFSKGSTFTKGSKSVKGAKGSKGYPAWSSSSSQDQQGKGYFPTGPMPSPSSAATISTPTAVPTIMTFSPVTAEPTVGVSAPIIPVTAEPTTGMQASVGVPAPIIPITAEPTVGMQASVGVPAPIIPVTAEPTVGMQASVGVPATAEPTVGMQASMGVPASGMEAPTSLSTPMANGYPPSRQYPDFLPDYSFGRYTDNDGNDNAGTVDEFIAASEQQSSSGNWLQDVHFSEEELQMLQNAADNPLAASTEQVTTQSTCSLGSTGFYGNAIGTVYDITFIYQALLTTDATESILKTEVAPALDVGIPEALLPLFFSDCETGRRLQMSAATIEGLSRMETDYVLGSPDLCAGSGAGGNCYVFSGSINVFGSNFFTKDDVENTVIPAIQRVIQSDQLLTLSPFLEKVTYLENGLVTGNPAPTAAPQPAVTPSPTVSPAGTPTATSGPTTRPVSSPPTASTPTLSPPTPTISTTTAPSIAATSQPTLGGAATTSPNAAVPSQPTQAPVSVTPAPVAPTEAPTSGSKRGVQRVPLWAWILVALFGVALLVCICYLAIAKDDVSFTKPSSSDVPDKDGDIGSYEPPGGDGYVPPGGDTMDTSAFRVQPIGGGLGVVQEVGENQEEFQYGGDGEEETYEEETYEVGDGDDDDDEGEYEEGDEGDEEEEDYEDGEEYEEGDEEYEEGDEGEEDDDDEEYEDEYEEDGEEEPVSYADEDEEEGSYYEEETMETPDENDGQRQWR